MPICGPLQKRIFDRILKHLTASKFQKRIIQLVTPPSRWRIPQILSELLLNVFSDVAMRESSLRFHCEILNEGQKRNEYGIKNLVRRQEIQYTKIAMSKIY